MQNELDVLRAENVLLKELAALSEQRYQEIKRLKKRKRRAKKAARTNNKTSICTRNRFMVYAQY